MGRTISSDEQKELDFIQAYEALCKEHKLYVGTYNAPVGSIRHLCNNRDRLNFRYQISVFKDDAEDF